MKRAMEFNVTLEYDASSPLPCDLIGSPTRLMISFGRGWGVMSLVCRSENWRGVGGGLVQAAGAGEIQHR